MKGTLEKNTIVDELYTIKFFLKKGTYAESYRVKDREGATRYLKLFEHAKLKKEQYTDNGQIKEIQYLKKCNHRNLVAYLDNGGLTINDEHFSYVVLEFISGETLADELKRSSAINVYEAKTLVKGVLAGLDFLHQLSPPVIHNEITNLNVMKDLSNNVTTAKIIDFGYARTLDDNFDDFTQDGLNQIYLAPECLEGNYSQQSDLYACGVLLYHLIFGIPPWSLELSRFKNNKEKFEEMLTAQRSQPLMFTSSDASIDQNTLGIIIKALKNDPAERFESATAFIEALEGNAKVDFKPEEMRQHKKAADTGFGGFGSPKTTVRSEIREGDGFAAIAGMETLKELLKVDVIEALQERERYAEFGLTIPNGMLLYGPSRLWENVFCRAICRRDRFSLLSNKTVRLAK